MENTGTPASILIVEDNDPDVFLVEEALRSQGLPAKLRRSHDGEQALAILSKLGEAALPDLIIIDLNLPRVAGMDVLKHARSLPQLDGVPILILTSSQSRADRTLALQLGANAYIAKPPTLPEFLSAVGSGIRGLLERSAGAGLTNNPPHSRVYWYCRPALPCSKSIISKRATAAFVRSRTSRYVRRPVRRSAF